MPKRNDDTSSLSHTGIARNHIVFCPKYRRKAIYGKYVSTVELNKKQ